MMANQIQGTATAYNANSATNAGPAERATEVDAELRQLFDAVEHLQEATSRLAQRLGPCYPQ